MALGAVCTTEATEPRPSDPALAGLRCLPVEWVERRGDARPFWHELEKVIAPQISLGGVIAIPDSQEADSGKKGSVLGNWHIVLEQFFIDGVKAKNVPSHNAAMSSSHHQRSHHPSGHHGGHGHGSSGGGAVEEKLEKLFREMREKTTINYYKSP